jgi:probable F420-dependent oxidoreductase
MRVGVSLPVREMENDLGAIKAYAQLAETLGLSHLRVPDQVLRVGSGPLHEPMTLMAYLAGVTERIELVPSVIVLPSRQTALVAKQAAEIDNLSGGRLRLGIGVGGSEDEYRAMGVDFHTRGARCDEQLELLNLLWTRETVEFDGRFDQITGAGLNPLPVQRPIPIWIGARPVPGDSVIQRIGRYAAGWFVLADPTQYPDVAVRIAQAARANGRNPAEIGAEAGVAVVGPREAEWKGRVKNWRETGLTHLCLRTLGGGLDADQHLAKIREAVAQLPETE